MSEKLTKIMQSTLLKGTLIGGLTGVLGMTAAALLLPNAAARVWAWGLMGGAAGAFTGLLWGLYLDYRQPRTAARLNSAALRKKNQEIKLQLRKEDLVIRKSRVQTGDVSVHKEVVTENKTVIVPVTREELVIENKKTNPHNPADQKKQLIRIPIKRERVNIVKYPIVLNDVSIFRRRLINSQRIKETVKREKFKFEINGGPKVKETTRYRVQAADLAKLRTRRT